MKFQEKILPSGLRIITIPLHDTPTVTVLVMVEAGSKYETKNINGLSHFLEHICFKGTKKRPTALAISHELDSLGAQSNAFTSHEFTGYFAKAHKKHIETLLDVVSDVYLNPLFNAHEIDTERGVVIEEINMYLDMPQRHIYDLFTELLYGDQPAGWPIAGPKENIKTLTREDFLSYRKKHYLAEGTTVIVAGSFTEDETITALTSIFESIPRGGKESKIATSESQSAPEMRIEDKKTDQMHLILGFRTYPIGHASEPALKLLSAILGGGMSSRLFQKLREKMGVAYYTRTEAEFFTDHGFLAAATGVDPRRIAEVVSEVLSEFKLLTKESISGPELQKAKDYLVGTMYLDLESSDSMAEFYGYQAVLRQPLLTPEGIAQKIKNVTAHEMKEVARAVFTNERLNCAVVGDVSDKNALKEALTLSSP